MSSSPDTPLSTLLSQAVIAYTIELDNEFEHRFVQAGGRARIVSLVMWSNFLRFVGDGITVGELPGAAGLLKSRMLSTLGGMERWRYIAVGTGSSARRDGYGSARGLKSTWVVRPTSNGRKAEAIWPTLFDEIDARWRVRFGAVEPQAGQCVARPDTRLLLEAVTAGVRIPDDRCVVPIAHVFEIALERRGGNLELVEKNIARHDTALVEQLVDAIEALGAVHVSAPEVRRRIRAASTTC